MSATEYRAIQGHPWGTKKWAWLDLGFYQLLAFDNSQSLLIDILALITAKNYNFAVSETVE